MITGVESEDWPVQKTFAQYLRYLGNDMDRDDIDNPTLTLRSGRFPLQDAPVCA